MKETNCLNCDVGYYLENNSCNECHYSCVSCEHSNTCIECQEFFEKNPQNQCQCIKDYEIKDKKCIPKLYDLEAKVGVQTSAIYNDGESREILMELNIEKIDFFEIYEGLEKTF